MKRLLSLAAILVSAALAHGQCANGVCISPAHAVVNQAVSFGHVHQAVQVAQPLFLYRYSAVQASSELTQDQIDLIASRTADEVVKRLKSQGIGVTPTNPPVEPAPTNPPVEPTNPPPPAKIPVSIDPGTDAGIRVLANRCAACHTGPASKGKFPIFGLDGKLDPTLTLESWVKMLDRSTHEDPTKVMPPAPKPVLTVEEVVALKQKIREIMAANPTMPAAKK